VVGYSVVGIGCALFIVDVMQGFYWPFELCGDCFVVRMSVSGVGNSFINWLSLDYVGRVV